MSAFQRVSVFLNMEKQLELSAQQPPRHEPQADVNWLEQLLDGAGCWMTAKDISLTTQGKVLDREVREIASKSKWILSGPGSPGYKHIKHATAKEIQHFKDALISQGKLMIKRGIRISHAAHEIFG